MAKGKEENCTPEAGESEDDFIGRCIGIMVSKGKDSSQAAAICHSIWNEQDSISIPDTRLISRRYITKAEFRIEDEEGEPTIIAGYAAVFNRWSEDLGFFKEKIRKGAFADSIQSDDIRALINHDPNLIIGRTKNKTLKLWEDDDGLGFEVKLPNTTYAADLVESVRRKDITQNSFGFQTQEDEWSPDRTKRELIRAKLFDISPVTFPAYKQTTIMVRLLEIGIDYEAIDAALIRAEQGRRTDSDVDLFNQTIGILARYVPIPPESIAPEPPKETVDYSALIRTRIASKTIHSILGGKRDES